MEIVMAIQELTKDEIGVVSGGAGLDLAHPISSLLGLVLSPVLGLVSTVGMFLDGLVGGMLGSLLGSLLGSK